MSRKYEKVQMLMPVIKQKIEFGYSYRQIAEEFQLDNEKVIRNLIYRERHSVQSEIPKQRGRKPAKTLQDYKYENKRLKMENELLRDFLSLTERKEYHITPSMSRRGNPYDNALAENFFSILKTECIHRIKLQTFEEARLLIDEYIHFYNHERIQLKTKLTPYELRSQLVA